MLQFSNDSIIKSLCYVRIDRYQHVNTPQDGSLRSFLRLESSALLYLVLFGGFGVLLLFFSFGGGELLGFFFLCFCFFFFFFFFDLFLFFFLGRGGGEGCFLFVAFFWGGVEGLEHVGKKKV